MGIHDEIDINDNLDLKQKIVRKLIKLHNGKLKIKKKGNKLISLLIFLPGERYTDFYRGEATVVKLI